MHRRAQRTNGKVEDETSTLLLSHRDSDSGPKRGSRITHNPFRNPKRNAVHPPLIVLVCGSLCCLLSGLVGFVALRGTTRTRRNVIPSVPRTFAHDSDEWFLSPGLPPGHRVHRREQRARVTVTPGHKVLHRRTLTGVSHGSEDEYSHQFGPIGREEDESEQHSDDYPGEDEFWPEEMEHSHDNPNKDEHEFSPKDDDKCTIPAAWENDYDMACNSMHEIDMMPTTDSFSFITGGGDRCVFRVTDIDDSIVILKTLR